MFNLCGSYVCENHPNELTELLPYVDILFGYVEEYKTLNKFVDVEKLSSAHKQNPDNISHDILTVLEAINGEAKIVRDEAKCDSGQDEAILESLTISPDHSNHKDEEVVTSGTRNSLCSSNVSNGHCNDTNGLVCHVDARKQKLVVVTKGPSPLLYVNNHVVCEQHVPPVSPKDIVDTTGAGDSFVGGFLAALSSKRPLDECLKCGTWTAQKLLQEKGCTLPTYPATFLRRN